LTRLGRISIHNSMPFIALILVVNEALMLASIKHGDAREEETKNSTTSAYTCREGSSQSNKVITLRKSFVITVRLVYVPTSCWILSHCLTRSCKTN
jgi:hypothetical protein